MATHEDSPAITLAQIRAWTDAGSYSRGRGYYERGHIIAPKLQGTTLKATCMGSQPRPYDVWVALGTEGIIGGHCTCPIGAIGNCKHAIALLLSWHYEPESFVETETVDTVLSRLERGDLERLLKKMIGRYPDLESLLELEVLSESGADSRRVDPEIIRGQVERALSGHGHEWGSEYDIADDLWEIIALGDTFLDREDWSNATRVFRTVADTVLTHYLGVDDDSGAIMGTVVECEERLGTCLSATKSADIRQEILLALFRICRWDVEQGGYGTCDMAPALLTDLTTDEERELVASWLRERLSANRGDDTGSQWRRHGYGGLLLSVMGDKLDDNAYLQLCAETGHALSAVVRLLQKERVKDALTIAGQVTGYKMLRFADQFETHGYAESAWQLVSEQAEHAVRPWAFDAWLQAFAERHGDVERALQIALKSFWRNPSDSGYVTIRRIGEQLDTWADQQRQILDRLAAEGRYDVLVDIALTEGDGESALVAYQHLVEAEASSSDPYVRIRPGQRRRIAVAKAIRDAHPWISVNLTMQTVENLIAQRGRGNYAVAADHLRTVRDIYFEHDAPDRWETLIKELRDKHYRLPALQDELNKAEL